MEDVVLLTFPFLEFDPVLQEVVFRHGVRLSHDGSPVGLVGRRLRKIENFRFVTGGQEEIHRRVVLLTDRFRPLTQIWFLNFVIFFRYFNLRQKT